MELRLAILAAIYTTRRHQQVRVQVVSNGRVEIWWRPILSEYKIIKILLPCDRSRKVRSAG